MSTARSAAHEPDRGWRPRSTQHPASTTGIAAAHPGRGQILAAIILFIVGVSRCHAVPNQRDG